jgi:membrane associated rhomboid family serine protease
VQHDYIQNKTSTPSIIGHGFSHRGIAHLITNMQALQHVGPLAISTIAKNGSVQLYSGGLVISGITSCIWHQYLNNGTIVTTDSLGASGTISAVTTFLCLFYWNDMQVNLDDEEWLAVGVAGLISMVFDVVGFL